MNDEITEISGRGGVYFGDFHATWPFVKITVRPSLILVDIPFAKMYGGISKILPHYEFQRDRIISAYRVSAMLGFGIQIEHTYSDYPKRFVISASKAIAEEIQRQFKKT